MGEDSEPARPATRSRLRRWLRLGPSRAELRDEIAVWRRRRDGAEREARAAHERAKAAEAQVRRMRHELHDRLNQPGRAEGCDKIQFHRQAEADEFLRTVAAASGEPAAVYHTYDCKTCPRSPVTMQRYFHVGHRGSRMAQTSKAAAAQHRAAQRVAARRDGKLLRQRVDPLVVAKLLALKQEGVARSAGP